MRRFYLIAAIILILLLARMSLYTVDAAEYAYVTRLGKPLVTHDGADIAEGAGLHFGLPWPLESVQRVDRRLQHFDLQGNELLTRDAEGKAIDKNITVEAYVCWRIASRQGVDQFIKSLGTLGQAQRILGTRINSLLAAHIVQMRMDELVSTEAGKAPGRTRVDDTLDNLQKSLLGQVQEEVRKSYGIELVDIRLRRLSHPEKTREAIFERIRSERNKKVEEIRSAGELERRNIETRAEEELRGILADARSKEERIKGEADTRAIQIRNEAHSKDPEFYAFLKKLEKMQNILGDNRTVLLLSSHREIFDLLFQPPKINSPGAAFPAANGNPKSNGPVVPQKTAGPKEGR